MTHSVEVHYGQISRNNLTFHLGQRLKLTMSSSESDSSLGAIRSANAEIVCGPNSIIQSFGYSTEGKRV